VHGSGRNLCTMAARMRAEFVARFVALLMVRAILFAPFPAMRMCLAAARSGQGRVSGAANP
jgi:hypothetical protein